jgi:hypothetical protein
MAIGSITSRLSNLNPFSKAPAKPTGATGRPEPRPHGGKEQGGNPPSDLHDSQPDPTSRKMTLGDKVSQGANLVGAAATVYPMLKGDPKPPKPPSPADGTGLKGEELQEYQKAKVLLAVGQPTINW